MRYMPLDEREIEREILWADIEDVGDDVPTEDAHVETKNFSTQQLPETHIPQRYHLYSPDGVDMQTKNFHQRRELSRNYSHVSQNSQQNFPLNRPEFSPQNVQDSTQNFPPTQKKISPEFYKNHARYHHHFLTPALNVDGPFEEQIATLLAQAVNQTHVELEQFVGKRLRLVQIFYQPISVYDKNGTFVYLLGTILAEPYRGIWDFFRGFFG